MLLPASGITRTKISVMYELRSAKGGEEEDRTGARRPIESATRRGRVMRFKEDKVAWLSGIMLNRASGTIPVTNSVRSRFPGYPDRAAVHRSTGAVPRPASPRLASPRENRVYAKLTSSFQGFLQRSSSLRAIELQSPTKDRGREKEREREEVYASRELFYFSLERTNALFIRFRFLSELFRVPAGRNKARPGPPTGNSITRRRNLAETRSFAVDQRDLAYRPGDVSLGAKRV